MSVTATAIDSIRNALNSGEPGHQATAQRKILMGDMVEPYKETITLAVPATTINLLTQTTAKKAALSVQSVRVTAGAAAAGLRQIGDAAAAPSATVVALADAGDVLTFEAAVTTAIIVWAARAAIDPDTVYAPTS
jgi:hypothetical protein